MAIKLLFFFTSAEYLANNNNIPSTSFTHVLCISTPNFINHSLMLETIPETPPFPLTQSARAVVALLRAGTIPENTSTNKPLPTRRSLSRLSVSIDIHACSYIVVYLIFTNPINVISNSCDIEIRSS